jgi:hypothetical protein
MATAAPDVATELDLVRADGIRHYWRAVALLAEAEGLRDSDYKHDLMERCQRHTELAKTAALLTGSSS